MPDSFIEEIPRGDAAPPLSVPVKIQSSPRSRRIRLRVPAVGAVILQIPPHIGRERALQFFRAQHPWLLKMLARRESAANHANAPKRAETLVQFFEQHPNLSALGRSYALEIRPTVSKRACVIWRRDASPVIFQIPAEAAPEDALFAAARHFASLALPPRVAELAAQCDIAVSRVAIRNQRGRWGSCSGSGAISLNWRLVLLPPELQDYVIQHELAHRREMNHSERFWGLLSEWNPRNGWLDRELTRDWSWLTHLARD